MKYIVLISLIYLECISRLDSSALFTLNKIDIWRMNRFFRLDSPNQLFIRELIVKKEITEEDKLSVDYQMQSNDGKVLKSYENASFCGDDAGTEAGSVAEAVRKILGIKEMNCPIPQQKNTMVDGVVEVEMPNADDDTNCDRFFIHADVRVNRADNPVAKMDFSVTRAPCEKKEEK